MKLEGVLIHKLTSLMLATVGYNETQLSIFLPGQR